MCTNGLAVLGNFPFEAYSPPAPGYEKNDVDFISKHILAPFFLDITTMSVGGIYSRLVATTDEDDLTNDSEVIEVNRMVKRVYNFQFYETVMMVKVTWEGVAQFGGADSEVISLVELGRVEILYPTT